MAMNPFQADEQDMFRSLPRLAGRLTAELIMRSQQGLNPSKEYELDLRGARGKG
jgi:U2 small nuclear ribonucleoprotein A'